MRRPGYVRLGNKRAGAPGRPGAGESAVDLDRRNPVLDNPFALHDHRDTAARAAVIERYREKYDDDLRNGGPMAEATEALAQRVRSGERLVLMCWCWPKPCHGRLIVAEINRRVGLACEGVSGANAPKGKSRST
ncbi:MAG TPA: DUF4326 domain-containing protein [Roseiarcus sp.]